MFLSFEYVIIKVMFPQKTYSLTDIANKIGNWYFNLNVIQQAVVLVAAGLIIREIAPKNYYYSAPKPAPIFAKTLTIVPKALSAFFLNISSNFFDNDSSPRFNAKTYCIS